MLQLFGPLAQLTIYIVDSDNVKKTTFSCPNKIYAGWYDYFYSKKFYNNLGT